MKNKVVAQV